jgi:hypothetical protein
MNVRIAQIFSFTAGCWDEGQLIMKTYTAKIWMVTQVDSEEEQNIAFRRIKHFMFYDLDSSIFIDQAEKEKCKEFSAAGLSVVTMPTIPVDQVVGLMLYHKLSAVMEGRIGILEIEIRADDGVIWLHSEDETISSLTFPDWWTSPDLVHSDQLTNDENIVSMKPVTTWRELDLAWPESDKDPDNGNTIVFANFNQNDTK